MAVRIRSDRLKDIMWAYAAAVLAASAAIALLFTVLSVFGSGRAAHSLLTQIGTGFALAALAAGFAIPLTFLLALLPAAAVIVYAEPRGVRSPVAYALLGALVAVVSVAGAVVVVDLMTYRPPYSARATPPAEFIRLLALACLLFVIPGLCGGLTYWAKAGRHAGGATGSA